jgi:hypothetical protein
LSDLGHWVSNLEETVLGKLGPWDCVLAVLIADLTDIIDLVTSTDACALDELSLAIRTLLGAVNLRLIRDAVTHSVYVLVWWAYWLDLSLTV